MVTKCIHPRPNQRTIRLGGVPISVSRLCESIAVSQPYLSRVLKRKKIPTIPMAIQIAEGLGITVGELIEELKIKCLN